MAQWTEDLISVESARTLDGLFLRSVLFEEMGVRYVGPVDGHDMRALSDALKNLLVAPTHARVMGEAGRVRVYSLFTVERMVRRIHDVYKRLLS